MCMSEWEPCTTIMKGVLTRAWEMNKQILIEPLLVEKQGSAIQCSNDTHTQTLSLFPVAPTWSRGHPWIASFHFSFLILRQSVGLLERGINPSQGFYLKQTQNKHRHPCLEWDSNIPAFEWAKTVHSLDRAATVIGRNDTKTLKLLAHRCRCTSFFADLLVACSHRVNSTLGNFLDWWSIYIILSFAARVVFTLHALWTKFASGETSCTCTFIQARVLLLSQTSISWAVFNSDFQILWLGRFIRQPTNLRESRTRNCLLQNLRIIYFWKYWILRHTKQFLYASLYCYVEAKTWFTSVLIQSSKGNTGA
jgi:hypothetical protein